MQFVIFIDFDSGYIKGMQAYVIAKLGLLQEGVGNLLSIFLLQHTIIVGRDF